MPQQRGAAPIPPPPGGAQLDKEPEKDNYNFPGGGSMVANLGIGAAKGATSTLDNWIGIANKAGGKLDEARMSAQRKLGLYASPGGGDVPQIPPQYTQPSNYQQSLGKQAEQMGEYGLAAAAVPYAAIPQGLAAAGVSGLHGGTGSEMLGTGIMGALTPIVTGALGRAANATASWAANSYPGRVVSGFVNSHIPVPPPPAPPPIAQQAGRSVAGAATRMFRGLPPAANEALTTVPKAEYSWSEGEPQITVHPTEAPVAPPTPKQVGSGTIPGQKALPPSPVVMPDGTIDITGHGQAFGQEGPLPPPKNETVTPVKPKPVRGDKGAFRKGTADDVQAQKGNAGRTITEVEKPTPPPKKGKK